MSDAPERIWTQREFHQTSVRGSACTHETTRHAVEYVRADIIAAKDEKMDWCANLSMQRLVAVRELGDLLGEALSEIDAKDAEIARLRDMLKEASEVLHGQMERGTSDMAHKIDAQLKEDAL